ncbi:hypothetical protein DPEC_G00231980 [Dallia pectoralis]|uniref:Uncharacterized protein n=1 Tax=Dallia pectoralis TaxID=75939 RepID=A0ACC2FXC2_DALPE|nr:hypothetical protein DPEC_G00231980 [Dallia pectoralis]
MTTKEETREDVKMPVGKTNDNSSKNKDKKPNEEHDEPRKPTRVARLVKQFESLLNQSLVNSRHPPKRSTTRPKELSKGGIQKAMKEPMNAELPEKRSVAKPASAFKPVAKTVAGAADSPVVKPVDVAPDKHAAKTVTWAADVSLVKPVAVVGTENEPVVKPVTEATVQHVVNPTDAVDGAAFKPVVKPVGGAPVEPVDKHVSGVELIEASDLEPVKAPADKVLAEKDVMVPATEPTATPYQGQSSSLVLPQADAEQHHQKIIHEFRHTEDGKAICSYCNNSIVENVMITVKEPPTYSHLYCFKCKVCNKNLMNAELLHMRTIHCHGCHI